MLINILEKVVKKVKGKDKVVHDGNVTIKYNQKPITVKPGESLDVRDFGVPNEHIKSVERHILKKNPNTFDQEATKDMYKTNKAALARIDELEKENAGLEQELKKAREATGGSKEDTDKLTAENEGLVEANKLLKEEVAELKAKVKALE